ncbi:MAG TPA: DUF898 family protein [Candidatus Enterosoma merdigallinarum]|nr:DUF898 family protein [Candidatus Enterosoma merdigallinarum]
MTMDNFTATEIDIILKKHRILFLFRVIAIVCAALALLVAIAFFLLFRFGKSDISQLKICLFIAVPFAVLLFIMAYLSGWEKNYWVFKAEKKRLWFALDCFSSHPEKTKKEFEKLLASGRIETFLQKAKPYEEKLQEKERKLIRARKATVSNGESQYDGSAFIEALLAIGLRLFSLVSLGLLFPPLFFFRCRYLSQHIKIDGKRLIFEAELSSFYRLWLAYLCLSLITIGVFLFFLPSRIRNWTLLHFHLEGESAALRGGTDSQFVERFAFTILSKIVNLLTLYILKPYIMVTETKFLASRTVLDGRRLVFDGSGTILFADYIKWYFLTIVTLGVYAFFVRNRLLQYKVKHIHLQGSASFFC